MIMLVFDSIMRSTVNIWEFDPSGDREFEMIDSVCRMYPDCPRESIVYLFETVITNMKKETSL